ncbi:MAG TPA: RNA-binding protein [Puia sp.]|nr:RNA-binding protein [Puia sp.]
MQIRVGNLNKMTTPGQLAELFQPFGRVFSVRIVSIGMDGRSQGTGLIQMDTSCGRRAVRKLHWLLFMNSYIEVDEIS